MRLRYLEDNIYYHIINRYTNGYANLYSEKTSPVYKCCESNVYLQSQYFASTSNKLHKIFGI